ncbi:MAG: helix-turn-helix transcriptional regulator [Chloroflexota bacterium]|nr:helix-turn-helix transcriptional regulator [Chloroflexota bacterium]MDE2895915.1 helix-turn-helix transcriptional regulator [Chloroflexota bacterium]
MSSKASEQQASEPQAGDQAANEQTAEPSGAPTPEQEETLGQRVRALRQKQKLSLNDLARLSGVSKGYLSQVERSLTVRPSAFTIFSIAEALGTTVGELFEGRREGDVEAASDFEVPEALRAFADEADLPPTDINMLAAIRFRGAQPREKEDWRFLYESIRRSIRGPGGSAAPAGE